jgi:signal transduction histidine kinase
MRQRAEELGGIFRLESLPGRGGGTLVRGSFPLTEEVT